MKGIGQKALSVEERSSLEQLRREKNKIAEKERAKHDSDASSSEDEEVGELPKADLSAPMTRISTGPRISVSAECYGKYNKKAAFQARVINKSNSIKDQ